MPNIFVSKNTKKAKNYSIVKPQTSPSPGKQKTSPIKNKTLKTNKSTGALKYPKTHEEKEKLPGHTHHPLASFHYFPDKFRFVNQDKEEKIVLFLRKHPITNLGWILMAFLLIILPTFLPVLSLFAEMPVSFQAAIVLIWYLITIAFILEKFLSWYFHVNILTDERIIEVDFLHLVNREITEANLDQVEDATVVIIGAKRTFFNYGDVVIQTAGAIPKVDFDAVPNPDAVAKILRGLRIEEEVEKIEGRVR